MKRTICFALALVQLLFILAACGSATDAPESIQATSTTTEDVAQAGSTSELAGEEPSYSFQDGILISKDVRIEITDVQVVSAGGKGNEFGSKPLIVFFYDTTNLTGNDAVSAYGAWLAMFAAYQDTDPNVVNELDLGAYTDGEYSNTAFETIKQDGTVSSCFSYELDSETIPVVLKATRGSTGEALGEQTFDIAELVKADQSLPADSAEKEASSVSASASLSASDIDYIVSYIDGIPDTQAPFIVQEKLELIAASFGISEEDVATIYEEQTGKDMYQVLGLSDDAAQDGEEPTSDASDPIVAACNDLSAALSKMPYDLSYTIDRFTNSYGTVIKVQVSTEDQPDSFPAVVKDVTDASIAAADAHGIICGTVEVRSFYNRSGMFQVDRQEWTSNSGILLNEKRLADDNEHLKLGRLELSRPKSMNRTDVQYDAVADAITDMIAEYEYEAAQPTPSQGERNALSRAKQYLRILAFSYTGLIEQLEFEGYTHDEAVYAADNCEADWYEQAVKKAQQYLDISSFSRSGLIDQLLFEGFTQDEAEYAVDQVY